MPLPSTSIMDPIDNPAFSHSWTSEKSLRDSTGDTATATPLQPLRLAMASITTLFVTLNTVTPIALLNDMPYDAVASAIETQHTAASPNAQVEGVEGQTTSPAFGPDLPHLPLWMIHALAGSLSFLLVLALALLLAQFPPRLAWLSKEGLQIPRYSKLDRDEYELEMDFLLDGTSAVAASREQTPIQPEHMRKRRPNHLSIDTSAQYPGLGIAVPGAGQGVVRKAIRARQSYDEESLRVKSASPMERAWAAFTAPLSTATVFPSDAADQGKATDIECGIWSASSDRFPLPNAASPHLYARHPCQLDAGKRESEETSARGFGWMNDVIYRIADKLSETFYDHVGAPEGGLLLPVREEEREKGVTPGMHMGGK